MQFVLADRVEDVLAAALVGGLPKPAGKKAAPTSKRKQTGEAVKPNAKQEVTKRRTKSNSSVKTKKE